MKNYLAVCDVGEGSPFYEFIVRAKTLKEADKFVRKTLKADYPDNWEYNKNDYSVRPITANELLKFMTIN